MNRVLVMVAVSALAVAAFGCRGAQSRAWQSSPMPSHDRQTVFEAGRDVLAKHFEIAEESFTAGSISTKPKIVDRPRTGTLADVRGAGGQWRRMAVFSMDRDGLSIVARMAVMLQREATEAAIAAEAASGVRGEEAPGMGSQVGPAAPKRTGEVWVDVGSDDALARELLAEIAERVRRVSGQDAMPEGQSPREAAEETRRIGAQER